MLSIAWQFGMAVSLKQCTAYLASFNGLMAGPIMLSLSVQLRACKNAFAMRYEMTLRMRSRAAGLAVTICLAVVGNSGRAQSMLSGQFVNHDNPVEVDMLRLVESPPGHLSGSLVVSSSQRRWFKEERRHL